MRAKMATLMAGILTAGAVLAQTPGPAKLAGASTNAACPAITAEQLGALMRGTNDVLVVNVMTKLYFDDCHIAGSTNIPERQLAETVRDWPRDRRIVVYCKDAECETSRDAARTLARMGFTWLRIYEGGIKEWRARGFASVGPGNLLLE